MARVDLRAYLREISDLIDGGKHAEAIAHGRHVLRHFPKHLESYRLVGKAYLESGRHDEAADVFQRIVRAAPDDFVAHVGLSIIGDERGDLGTAIWHMQRAFEAQPSNPAIQTELQRLFGRRDGAEPPKIRMTRGALARMYVQGELYEQAIAELRAVLGQEPQRRDLQVLLAHACYRAGQNAEAAGVCTELLREYPYSLDANRIMTGIFPPAEGNESREVYRRRVIELDPYAAFSSEALLRSDAVPDAKVQLERLPDASAADAAQKWIPPGALGVVEEYAEAGVPEEALTPGPSPADQEEVARQRGAEGSEREPRSLLEGLAAARAEPGSDSAEAAAAGLVPAELPAWLREKMPAEESIWSEDRSLDTSPDVSATPGPGATVGAWEINPSPTGASGTDTGRSGSSEDAEGDVPAWLRDLGTQGAESYSGAASAGEADREQAASFEGEAEAPSTPLAAALPQEGEPDGTEAEVLGWLGGLGEGAEVPSDEPAADEPAEVLDLMAGGEEPLAAEPPDGRDRSMRREGPADQSTVDWFRSLEEPASGLAPEEREEAQKSEQLFAAQENQDWEWGGPSMLDAAESGVAAEPAGTESEPSREPRDSRQTEDQKMAGESVATSAEHLGQEPQSPDLAEWLADLDAVQAAEDQRSPQEPKDWGIEEPEPAAAPPTSASDWRPAEPKTERVPHGGGEAGAPGVASRAEAPEGRPADQAALNDAQRALERGEVASALEMYAVLIRKGRFLEETLRDLREMVYRYPVDVGLWQTLGDAYMRANRLQEALDAYNKAEELIR